MAFTGSKIKIIESVFDNIGAVIKKKNSSNNNYTNYEKKFTFIIIINYN